MSADLYEPFQSSRGKPGRVQLVRLLRRLYGPGIPTYPGSPYAGTALNDAELVLHELAHMTQFDFEGRVPVGDMEPTWQVMFDATDEMAEEDADQHEVEAVAIVLLASGALGLPLARIPLVKAGARNTAQLRSEPTKFDALVSEAEGAPAVRSAADQVVALIDLTWEREPRPHGVRTRRGPSVAAPAIPCLAGGERGIRDLAVDERGRGFASPCQATR
jgi:hypothetical protein